MKCLICKQETYGKAHSCPKSAIERWNRSVATSQSRRDMLARDTEQGKTLGQKLDYGFSLMGQYG